MKINKKGCDGSILIAGSDGSKVGVERDVGDNKSLAQESFELVNEVKSLVETKCPGVVSCADVLAIAARDFVHLVRFLFFFFIVLFKCLSWIIILFSKFEFKLKILVRKNV